MQDLLNDAAGRAIGYLETLPTRAVAPDPAAVAALDGFEQSLPSAGTASAQVLAELDALGSPATVASAGPRFFGFVIGACLPVTLAANWLAGAWDQNTGLYNITPVTARLEQLALRWLVELFGLPSGTGGAFVTGATMANFVSLAAARHALLTRAGWNVEADGLFGAPPVKVIVSEEVHPTLIKGLGLVGFGRERVLRVPVDHQGRMRAEQLPAVDGMTLVCAQVGNVNTGGCDPVAAIAERLDGSGAWLHVDGAFGMWAAAVPSLAGLVEGLQRADSWATDAHKWLNVPYDSGVAFVRDPESLRAAMAVTAEYLPSDAAFRNPSDYTPELSRRARGVEVWAALRGLGREGVIELVERNCRQARRFAEGLRDAGHVILNDVVLNQVLVSFGSPETTRRVIAAIQADGTCWCGGTVWQGQTAMRISVCSWATTDADVERSLDAICRIAAHAQAGA